MTINENTGIINVASNPKNCSNGATITVTAKTPSGKSTTATIYYEKDLALTHENKTYTKMIKHMVNLQHLLLTPIKMLVGILKQQKNHHIVILIMLTKIKQQHL